MKEFECSCYIGSVLIGNEEWTFAVPNIGGNGTAEVRIYDSINEFCIDAWAKDMNFVSTAQGRFGIFEHDRLFYALQCGLMTMKDSKIILNGRYGVYNGFYKVAFVKMRDFAEWED